MRLTDFGLAKRNISTSQRDTACGTPLYMPPEAIANMRDGGGECTRSHVDTTLGFAPCLVSEILCRAPVCLLRVWATARRVRPASRLVDARHAPLRDAVRKDTVRAPRHACLVVQDPGLLSLSVSGCLSLSLSLSLTQCVCVCVCVCVCDPVRPTTSSSRMITLSLTMPSISSKDCWRNGRRTDSGLGQQE